MVFEVLSMSQVTIYSTPTCIYCKLERSFTEHKISFKVIDVSEDSQAAQQMIMKSGQSGVPVTD